eukprot:360216-Pelagomonas_calceolata.AAC.7
MDEATLKPSAPNVLSPWLRAAHAREVCWGCRRPTKWRREQRPRPCAQGRPKSRCLRQGERGRPVRTTEC